MKTTYFSIMEKQNVSYRIYAIEMYIIVKKECMLYNLCYKKREGMLQNVYYKNFW